MLRPFTWRRCCSPARNSSMPLLAGSSEPNMPIKSLNELKSRRFILASKAQRHLGASNQQTGRGPPCPLRVTSDKTHVEHNESALPLIADIPGDMAFRCNGATADI